MTQAELGPGLYLPPKPAPGLSYWPPSTCLPAYMLLPQAWGSLSPFLLGQLS